ncbi:MAG: GLPGLI family protein [Bacteroidetes bacterium]|nr:GLPGLI family protein [Bacteroidota bacterium]
MEFIKKTFYILIFLSFSHAFSQVSKTDSLRGRFTYLLKSKPNKLYPNQIYKELFSLQVGDNKAFFISEKQLQLDSIFYSALKPFQNKTNNTGLITVDFSGKSLPKTNSNFILIQNSNETQYFEKIGSTLLSYLTPNINNWALKNEIKIINSYKCRKAEVHFKGRDWIAWYSDEIAIPFGPYKFNSLPGLIIKISDKLGDYDFELVNSFPNNKLKGKIIEIDKSYFENPKIVSKIELSRAKNNFRESLINSPQFLGVNLTSEQKEKFRTEQKNDEIEKKGYNPIELE